MCKYKGLENASSQIKASFRQAGRGQPACSCHCSPNDEFIICGSEDHNIYVWYTDPASCARCVVPSRQIKLSRAGSIRGGTGWKTTFTSPVWLSTSASSLTPAQGTRRQ